MDRDSRVNAIQTEEFVDLFKHRVWKRRCHVMSSLLKDLFALNQACGDSVTFKKSRLEPARTTPIEHKAIIASDTTPRHKAERQLL